MKIQTSSAFFVLLTLLACGKSEQPAYPDAEVKLCDPADNPSACPASLRDQSQFSRELVVGDQGIGIEVQKYTNEKMLGACQQQKMTLLSQYLDPTSPNDGLKEGEFISAMAYEVVSSGSICTKRNVFKGCDKRISTARIVCKYEVHSSPALVPSKPN